MLCCKESQRLIPYEVGKIQSGQLIENFGDVAKIIAISVEKIRNHPHNKLILNKKLSKGDKIYYPNPPHCDDAKSKFDKNKVQTVIINPAKNEDLVQKLQFSDNGMIENPYKNAVINDTFKVLALNCATLLERRMEKWLYAYINCHDENVGYWGTWMEEFTQMEASDEMIKSLITNRLHKLIIGKSTPDENGLLESFYFVEVAFLQSLFNGK